MFQKCVGYFFAILVMTLFSISKICNSNKFGEKACALTKHCAWDTNALSSSYPKFPARLGSPSPEHLQGMGREDDACCST